MDLASFLPQLSSAMDEPGPAQARLDAEAAAREAERERVEAVRAEVTAMYEQRMADLVAANEAAMLAARQQWCEEQGETLAAGLAEQLSHTAEHMASNIARVLQPFVGKVLRHSAVKDFCGKVVEAIGPELQGSLVLSGPQDLVAACERSLSASGVGNIATAGGTRLAANANGTRLASNIELWLADLMVEDNG